jgi:hypothetical protein
VQLLGVGSTLTIALGCEPAPRDIVRIPSSPVEPSVTIDDASELGAACPSALEPCESNFAPACRASCQPTAEGCANVWELHRFNEQPPGLFGAWVAFDPAGNHGVFARYERVERECSSSPCGQPEPLLHGHASWSANDGVASIESEPWLSLHGVSDDASIAFGSSEGRSVYWTPTGGVQTMPIRDAAMARNGRLFAGEVDVSGASSGTTRRGARWVPGTDPTNVFEADSPSLAVRAEGDTALFVMPRTIIYSPAAGERVDIALPSGVPPDASFERAELSAPGTSFAVTLRSEGDTRLFLWADGSFEPIEMPAGLWAMDPIIVSDDGRVVVVGLHEGPRHQFVRWSADTGILPLSSDPTYRVEFMSAAGDLILGTVETSRRPLRWSLETGMQELPAMDRLIVAFDGNVLVELDDDGILTRKDGPAVGVPLPLDHLRGRLVSEHPLWLDLHRVSSDARVLGGSAIDVSGNEWLWLARLQTICPGGAP